MFYPVYTEQNYLNRNVDDINLDRDPDDASLTLDIHCSIEQSMSQY